MDRRKVPTKKLVSDPVYLVISGLMKLSWIWTVFFLKFHPLLTEIWLLNRRNNKDEKQSLLLARTSIT